ncbi:hypothetical protein ACH4Q6_25400 [Streptomyces lydicus]|uniref:hypothetical protein n=1 Tax=Streptomyces lydicus TaxID=47763 RepID=UPI0037A65745
MRFRSAQGVSAMSTHTLRRRFSGQKASVLIASEAPPPYQRIMVSYREPDHAVRFVA